MENATQDSLPSSNRALRNIAEKQRRDKLNAFIGELAGLVPVVAASARKLDKTSVLRLSAAFLRLHLNLGIGHRGERRLLSQKLTEAAEMILDTLQSFLVVISTTGRIEYVSRGVEKMLGYSQVDMMGMSVYCYVHPQDQVIIRQHLIEADAQGAVSRRDSLPDCKDRCVFECRIASRPLSRGEATNFERIQFQGRFRTTQLRRSSEVTSPVLDRTRSRRRRNFSPLQNAGACEPHLLDEYADDGSGECCTGETLLIALARVVQVQTLPTSMTIIDSLQDQYITRHLPDGKIINTDHRISIIAGYFTEEVMGRSAFGFIHSEDLHYSLVRFKQMSTHPRGEGSTTYRLVSRTGKLIYLRSRGYIEYNQITKEMVGFVCFNALLSEEEGEREIRQARELLANVELIIPPHIKTDPERVVTPPGDPLERLFIDTAPAYSRLGAQSLEESARSAELEATNRAAERTVRSAGSSVVNRFNSSLSSISSQGNESVQRLAAVDRLHFSGYRTLATQADCQATVRKRRKTSSSES